MAGAAHRANDDTPCFTLANGCVGLTHPPSLGGTDETHGRAEASTSSWRPDGTCALDTYISAEGGETSNERLSCLCCAGKRKAMPGEGDAQPPDESKQKLSAV